MGLEEEWSIELSKLFAVNHHTWKAMKINNALSFGKHVVNQYINLSLQMTYFLERVFHVGKLRENETQLSASNMLLSQWAKVTYSFSS